MPLIEFYDSNPGPFDTVAGRYPVGAQYAMLYADTSLEPGRRPQTAPADVHNLRYITRRGGTDAAAYAGACDYESGNVAFVGDNLAAWAAERGRHGWRARVYSNRFDVITAWPQVKDMDNVFWWIATLDNDPRWTPAGIVASVRAITGLELPAAKIWGIQWGTNGAYDTSTLFDTW